MSKLAPIAERLATEFKVGNDIKTHFATEWEAQAAIVIRYGTKLTNEEFLVLREELRVHLLSKKLLGVDAFLPEVEFHGYGDSGDMEGTTGEAILDDFFELCLKKFVHFDWYNNEGGSVEMKWDLDEDEIVINGYQNVIQTETVMDGDVV